MVRDALPIGEKGLRLSKRCTHKLLLKNRCSRCGVAGLTAAWLLQRQHQVHLFEKNDYLGGHTRTLRVPSGPDAGTAVDTGFIVMNHRNYPLFSKLLEQLQVPLDASSMTFSFYDQASRYGYSGNRLSSLFLR